MITLANETVVEPFFTASATIKMFEMFETAGILASSTDDSVSAVMFGSTRGSAPDGDPNCELNDLILRT